MAAKFKPNSKSTTLSALLLGAFFLESCATGGKGDGPPKRTHYVLRPGPVVRNPRPLPDQTLIYADWYLDTGAVQAVPGYRGWDFDGDGRFEMVDLLNEDDTTRATVFDFNGDGKIDVSSDVASGPVPPPDGAGPIVDGQPGL